MKTLIIAGAYSHNEYNSSPKVHYNVTLYGQTDKNPLVECVGFIDQDLSGYDELQRVARERYCKYFNVDLFNIISMETLNELKR